MASPRIRTAWANRNTHESLLRRWRRSLAYACSPVTDLCRATRSYRPTPICHRNSRLSWNFCRHSILFLPEQHTNELDFLQAQIQLSSSQSASNRTPMLLQIGRFTMDLGNRRLAARNRMRNTTNAFDGVLWRVGQDTNWTLRTFVSRPVIINPSDLDSSQDGGLFWGSSYTAAVTTDDNRKLLSWLEG